MQVNASVRIKGFSLCILVFLTLSIIACKPKHQSELYGTYIANYDVAKEKLTLDKDGAFKQEVTLKATSKVDASKGTWTYDPKTGYVSFNENFMLVLNGFRKLDPDYAHPKPGGVSQPATKYFGRVSLGSSEGILYKKVY
jgi:hypothetical protein